MAPALISAVLAVAILAMTVAASRGALPANGLLGIRTPATQRSEAAWREGHRAALKVIAPWSVVIVVLGLLIASGGTRGIASLDAQGVMVLALFGVMAVVAAVVAHRAASRVG